MEGKEFILKNRLRQPLPLEYAGKSISLHAGASFSCTEAEFLCVEIQRHIRAKRLKLISSPVIFHPRKTMATTGVVAPKVTIRVPAPKVVILDPDMSKMAPETTGATQATALEVEKEDDSLTSFSGVADNETVEVAMGQVETINACDVSEQEDDIASCPEPVKKRRKRTRSGKKDDTNQE